MILGFTLHIAYINFFVFTDFSGIHLRWLEIELVISCLELLMLLDHKVCGTASLLIDVKVIPYIIDLIF